MASTKPEQSLKLFSRTMNIMWETRLKSKSSVITRNAQTKSKNLSSNFIVYVRKNINLYAEKVQTLFKNSLLLDAQQKPRLKGSVLFKFHQTAKQNVVPIGFLTKTKRREAVPYISSRVSIQSRVFFDVLRQA